MSIKWAGQTYKVKLTREAIGGEDGPRSFLGNSSETDNTIVVDGTLPATRQGEVFLHELIHVADMNIPEGAVLTLGRNLYGILSENGLLARDFLGRVTDGSVTKAEMNTLNQQSREMSESPQFIIGRTTETVFRVSDKAWDGSASRFTPEQWRRSCLIHMDGDPDAKGTHKLPILEPEGAINRNACHAAAGALAGARGGVDAPMDKKKAAAKRLVGIYRTDLDEEPPEGLLRMAGR